MGGKICGVGTASGGRGGRRRGGVRALAAALGVAAVAAGGAALAQSGTGPAGCDAGERTIRFAHVVVADGHPKGEAAAELARIVNMEFDGRYCMIVYPDSTLYDDNDVFPALLSGDVEMAAPSLSKFEEYTRAFRIFDLPFMFRDLQAVEWFQFSGPGKRLMREIQGSGFRGLAFWNNGMKQLSANRPLLMPEDARGLTFRVQTSEVLEAQFAQIGAKTKRLAFKDVYDALAKGEVQGQENTYANIYSKEFYKVQDGVTETNHGLLAYLVITSDRFWESLPVRDRVTLNRIIVGVTARANDAAREIAERNKALLERAGAPIRRLSAEQRDAWVKAMRPVWDKFASQISSSYIEAAVMSNR